MIKEQAVTIVTKRNRSIGTKKSLRQTVRRFSREAKEPAYAGSFVMFVVLVIQDIGLQLLRSSRVT